MIQIAERNDKSKIVAYLGVITEREHLSEECDWFLTQNLRVSCKKTKEDILKQGLVGAPVVGIN
jgi:hypothetical protein